jgi:hypothetical protein
MFPSLNTLLYSITVADKYIDQGVGRNVTFYGLKVNFIFLTEKSFKYLNLGSKGDCKVGKALFDLFLHLD